MDIYYSEMVRKQSTLQTFIEWFQQPQCRDKVVGSIIKVLDVPRLKSVLNFANDQSVLFICHKLKSLIITKRLYVKYHINDYGIWKLLRVQKVRKMRVLENHASKKQLHQNLVLLIETPPEFSNMNYISWEPLHISHNSLQ